MCCRKIVSGILCCLLGVSSSLAQGVFFPEQATNIPLSYRNGIPIVAAGDTLAIVKQLARVPEVLNNDMDSARWLIQDGLKRSRYLSFDFGIALAYAHMALWSSQSGNYDAALKYFRFATPYALKGFRNPNTLAMFYSSMSGPYFYKAEFDSMSYFAYKAEQLIDTAHIKSEVDARNAANVYLNIGSLWSTIGDVEKAAKHTHKARLILAGHLDSAGARKAYSVVNANLGFIYFNSNDMARAERYYKEALKFDQNNGSAMIGIGTILRMQGKMREALPVLKHAVAVTMNDYRDHILALVALGKLYFASGNYQQAEQLLKGMLDEVETQSNAVPPTRIFDVYQMLSVINATAGHYQQAYDYQRRGRTVWEAQMEKEKIHDVYKLEIKSQTALMDKEIAQKRLLIDAAKSRLREKNIWMSAISGSAVLFVITLVALYRSSRHKQKLQSEKITLINREQEINNLKAMIRGEEKERARLASELHDGIMVQLSTVKMSLKSLPESYQNLSCMEYRETDHYRQMVQQMEDATTELRRTAHNLMPDMLLQGGITDAVSYFCRALQHAGLNISYQQYGTIPRLPQDFEISIFRIIQELLQNVMKHAAARKVMVQLAEVEDRILTVSVDDDGKGFDTQLSEAGKGMGLKSIRSRVQVLQGFMDVRSGKGEGTAIYLEFEMPESRVLAATKY